MIPKLSISNLKDKNDFMSAPLESKVNGKKIGNTCCETVIVVMDFSRQCSFAGHGYYDHWNYGDNQNLTVGNAKANYQ
jgi:hypothetical protein